ncbi:DUF5906 domain-containing protein [Bradyrhizobium sp. I1.7.5]|uniref:DUF5906 domain-containing protein n=1 Tax=Bradyrhizobium sp. I1.7.5 TaxID=3156363 RepID=UPI0033999BE2
MDSLSAQQNYERAATGLPAPHDLRTAVQRNRPRQVASQFNPPPSFAVQSSPGKLHVYWQTQQHDDRDRFTLLQRKLRTVFDGDKRVVDPSRVLRLPGTIHAKNPDTPHLVTCWALSNYNKPIDPGALEAALYGVSVIDGTGERYPLGEPKMQAPGWDWCLRALAETNPNDLDRSEWIGFTAAWKQAAWNLANEDQLIQAWSQWSMQYTLEDGSKPTPAYLKKNWNSVRNTEVGWPSLERRNGNLHALRLFGQKLQEQERKSTPLPMPHEQQQSMPVPTGELLTDSEQREWFKGCVLIGPENTIIGPRGIRYDVGSFNSTYGGKNFVIDGLGKTVNKPWEAATNSRLWRIPTVDGTCFRPQQATGEIVTDGLSRTYINTYIPATIERMDGDAMPFLRHVALVLPDANDQRIVIEFLAHNVRFPGHKIPWAPLIQSAEGIGKNVFEQIMRHVIDTQYFYQPKAKQLNDSGSKFNGWMEGKLFFLVDEIKTDEKRDMVETLKPFITETELEIEGKNINQRMGDTPGNWLFFSNHKDAIPIHKNGRRFASFYSPIQTAGDLTSRGMNDDYFSGLNGLFSWLGNEQNGGHKTGLKIVANYLLNYPIQCGAIPMRAPTTTGTAEALIESRGWLEQLIAEAVDDDCRVSLAVGLAQPPWPGFFANAAANPSRLARLARRSAISAIIIAGKPGVPSRAIVAQRGNAMTTIYAERAKLTFTIEDGKIEDIERGRRGIPDMEVDTLDATFTAIHVDGGRLYLDWLALVDLATFFHSEKRKASWRRHVHKLLECFSGSINIKDVMRATMRCIADREHFAQGDGLHFIGRIKALHSDELRMLRTMVGQQFGHLIVKNADDVRECH